MTVKLVWHRHPEGGLVASVAAGEYRIVKHAVKGYGPVWNGYELTTPLSEPRRWSHHMSQGSAKAFAQMHFERHYGERG